MSSAVAERGRLRSLADSVLRTEPRRLGAAVVLAFLIALAIALGAHSKGVAVLPTVLRTGVVCLVLFAVWGYAPAAWLVRGGLRPYRPLFVLPLGAVLGSLALTVLGLLHVPFAVNLPVVVVAGAALSAYAWRRRVPVPRDPELGRRIVVPFILAFCIATISLCPIFRVGFATVPGENGDAVLVAGSATLVEHAPPQSTRYDLPINHIPLEWRSKYPIYYALAAVATLAGQSPIAAFAPVVAMMLGLTAFGFFVFARYALRAPPWIALLAMFLLPLDRIIMYLAIHPYYNELWGQFALPFFLLAGWQFLSEPSRVSLVLLVVFGVMALFAYPLVIPFPVFFFVPSVIVMWRRARARGTTPGWLAAVSGGRASGESGRARWRAWWWIPALVVLVPLAAVLGRGFLEKSFAALDVLAPGTNLSGWGGPGLGEIPGPKFFGLPSGWTIDYVVMGIILLIAAYGLTRIRSAARAPLTAMLIAGAVVGIYFRVRVDGQLFWFKDMSFLGPYVLLAAFVGLGTLVAARGSDRGAMLRRAGGLAGIAAALVIVPTSGAREINQTYDNATPGILQLARWNTELPRGTSIRIDVPASGYQLWTMYMLYDHPLCALDPLGGFFPSPVYGRKADYVIAERTQGRPADAIGAPLLHNHMFELWRMNPDVPGPSDASRNLGSVSEIGLGL